MKPTAHDAAGRPAPAPHRPSSTTDLLSRLADLHTAPATLGPVAIARRQQRCGDTITIAPCPASATPALAARLRDGTFEPLDAWPATGDWQTGDRVVVMVAATADGRAAFVAWLSELQPPPQTTLAPCSADEGALHRLWCVAAARVVLPSHVGIEARHDLLGIRLAQLSLAMGADILSGPIEADRVLPLAGVPRPTESTRAGLQALVEHARLSPRFAARPQ